MIDFTKPIEHTDGSPAYYLGRSSSGKHRVASDTSNAAHNIADHYYDNGRPVSPLSRIIRNTDTSTGPELDLSQPLQTVDGKRASLVGKMADKRLLVDVYYGTHRPPAKELRWPDGRVNRRLGQTCADDLVNKVIKSTVYKNVYADATFGSTEHDSEENAKARSKYSKVRVGILRIDRENGKQVYARMSTGGYPWFRSVLCPGGRLAVAADYSG